MALKLTLKPDEFVIINGALIRNGPRRHQLTIETVADVIRGSDILTEKDANTPLTRLYFVIQSVLVDAKLRAERVPIIQNELATLVGIFGPGVRADLIEAANNVSTGNFYKALSLLREPIKYERQLLDSR